LKGRSPSKKEILKGELKRGKYGVPAKTKFLWGKKPLLHNQFPLSFEGEILKGELEGRSPS